MRYVSWTDGYAVGFQCIAADGTVTFIYLNPSSSDSEGVPNIFLYSGPHGDPAKDAPVTWVPSGEAV